MTKNYYQQEILIPRVDENDAYLGPIERWEAHEKGILHRAFTVAVFYKDQIICQHRKHPVFDDVYDFTASSHPQVIGKSIQSNKEAVILTLMREWNLQATEITNLKEKGFALYNDKDPKSKYIEHEYCYLYICETEKEPVANHDISYGFSLATIESLKNKTHEVSGNLAPWVSAFFKKGLL